MRTIYPNIALLVYYLLYFLLAVVWRAAVVYKRSGKNPFVLPAEDNAYGYVGRAFKLLIAAVAAVVTLNAAYPGISHPGIWQWLGPFSHLQTQSLQLGGWSLLLASLAWMLIAQVQMGESWRIGIDSGNSTALVCNGLFSISRNPIFLSTRVNLLGLFLVLPNAVTLVALVAGEQLMQIQVRLEEHHLTSLHGEQYVRYKSRVRRWL